MGKLVINYKTLEQVSGTEVLSATFNDKQLEPVAEVMAFFNKHFQQAINEDAHKRRTKHRKLYRKMRSYRINSNG